MCACVRVCAAWPSVCAYVNVHLYTCGNIIFMLHYIENLPMCIANA